MAAILYADTRAIVELARRTLTSSHVVTDAWHAAVADADVPENAVNHNAVAQAFQDTVEATIDAADLAVGRLIDVLALDVDLLYQTAFAYQRADEESAATINPFDRVDVEGRG